MNRLLSPSWWLSMLVSTFMTMVFIYIIKKIATTANVPIVSEIVQEV